MGTPDPVTATAATAPVDGARRVPGWLVGLGLFVAAAIVSGVTARNGIQPNDEGLMLQAARRIADGQIPYRDFWWFYPPGQPYLLGGITAVFGPSLLWWRIVRVLADATVALLVWRLARRRAGPWVSLAGWGITILAMAHPSGPHPFPIALAMTLGALLLFERRPVWAGVLAGLCAVWRIEFAAYLGLGILIAYAVRPAPWGERLRAAGRFAAPAALTGLVLYGPVVAAAGWRPSWDLLIRYPIVDFQKYQGLPYPISYTGPLNVSSLKGFLTQSAETLLLFYLPTALLLGAVASVVVLGLTFRRERDWPVVATVVVTVGTAHYLLVRPDFFHTAPLAVAFSVVGAWAVAAARAERRTGARRAIAVGCAVLAGAAAAYALAEGVDRRWLLLRQDNVALRAAVADGVRAAPDVVGPLDAVVADVQRRVPPGRPIYVLGRRSDITTAGAPLLYVLADRPNPTRFDIAAPGVVTSAAGQAEIVADLQRTRPGAVVRWTDIATAADEPDLAGKSSGVHTLDRYLARAYREAARYGDWIVLVPRAASPQTAASAPRPGRTPSATAR